MAALTHPTITQTLVLVFGLVAASACADEPVEVPEPRYGNAVCMTATSFGYNEDNTRTLITNPIVRIHPAGCDCLPSEDRYPWAEEDRERLAELALADCEHLAELYFDFVRNDCQADFEAKAWDMDVFSPSDDETIYLPDGLVCIPEP